MIQSARECCCTCTWNESTRPVGGTRCRQCEWRAAGGGSEGRMYGHHVATGERHRAVGETHTLLHTPRTHHCQKQHGDFKRHLKQTGDSRREWESQQMKRSDLKHKHVPTELWGTMRSQRDICSWREKELIQVKPDSSMMDVAENNNVRISQECMNSQKCTYRGSGTCNAIWLLLSRWWSSSQRANNTEHSWVPGLVLSAGKSSTQEIV